MTCRGELQAIVLRESEIVRTIRDYLSLIGAWHIKTLGGVGQRVGVPDLVACVPTRAGHVFVAIEAKRPTRPGSRGGTVSKAQQAELTAIARAGGIAIVARDLDDVRAVLEPLGLAHVEVIG